MNIYFVLELKIFVMMEAFMMFVICFGNVYDDGKYQSCLIFMFDVFKFIVFCY